MIERVRREETWQQPSVNIYPDPYKIIRIQFPVVEELRDTPRETWPSRDALPSTLMILADTFQDAGWHGLAVRMFQEALEFVRLDADRANLRRTLDSLRKSLVALERYEEALPVAEEELALALELARPGSYDLEIANEAWYSMTDLLGKLGRHEDAARVAGEAVEYARGQKKVKNGPPEGYPLAHKLSEYADRLTAIGEYERAIEAAAEAAAFWQHRDTFATGYEIFNDLSLLQQRLGRIEEARTSHAAAVETLRRPAEKTRDWTYLSNLAGALTNHGIRLHDLGFDEDSVPVHQESVERYRALAAATERPETIRKMELKLGLALCALSCRFHDLGRLDECFAASDEAIALATKHDDRDQLAQAWTNRASALITRRCYAEAAEAAAKGLELYRDAEDKAMARNTFALASAHLGQHDVALEASLRSVAEYREWCAGDPYEYAYLLADALTDHALIRVLRAERAEAEAAIAESLVLHQELVARNPGRYQRELDRAWGVAAQI
ncbi:hypothetical protein ABZX92_32200 [Lentzea sp. NPDC006480]|uniref:hypothetical protein n=1 Tax=Lentzea sp. NPDC006480 TaxID=3157176 RepID=UPI0033B62446